MGSGPRWGGVGWGARDEWGGGGCGCTTRRGAMSAEEKLFEGTHHLGKGDPSNSRTQR